MSRGALSQGRDNHRLNGLPTDTIRFLGENILKSWSRIRKPGPYDVAVIDPPSFQRGSFVAQKDYSKVLRRITELMNPGADLLVCLNAPELGEAFICEQMLEACPACSLVGRLVPHADFPDIDPDQQLKLFHFRYLPDAEAQ
jgi:23S rRNA (cytosine1962-C5)-methyltransferase